MGGKKSASKLPFLEPQACTPIASLHATPSYIYISQTNRDAHILKCLDVLIFSLKCTLKKSKERILSFYSVQANKTPTSNSDNKWLCGTLRDSTQHPKKRVNKQETTTRNQIHAYQTELS